MRWHCSLVWGFLCLAGIANVQANPLYFDAATSTPLTWDQGTSLNWSLASGGPYNQAWADGVAIFEGTADTITVSGTITTVNGIEFNVPDYVLDSGTLNLAGTPTISNAGNATINSALTGSVGFTKTGAGTLTLGGASTYTGVTTINEGTVFLTNATALGATGIGNGTSIAAGATLDINGQVISQERISLAGTLTNAANYTGQQLRYLTVTGNSAAINVNAQRLDIRGQSPTANRGVLDLGTFTLTKDGTNKFAVVDTNILGTGSIVVNNGTFTFSRATMTTGSVIVNGGILQFENNNAPATQNYEMPIAMNAGSISSIGGGTDTIIKGTISFTGQRDVEVGSGVSLTLSGTLTGTGGIRKTGTGTLVITNSANNYATGGGTNKTFLLNGILAVVPTAILGTGTNELEFSSGGTGGGPITLQSFDTNTLSLNNAINVSSSATLGSSTTGNIELNGTVALGAQPKTLTINNAMTSLNGVIGGTGSTFTKTGSGILAINGNANTAVKPLAVDAGTLAGIGNYNGPVTIAAIATLAPGNSIGTLTINNTLTLNGLSDFELDASLAGLNSSDSVLGITDLVYGGNLQVSAVSGTLAVGQSWQLFAAANPSGTFANDSFFGTAGDGTLLPTLGDGVWAFDYGTGVLSIVAIPEPGTVTLLGIAGMLAIGYWRKRS